MRRTPTHRHPLASLFNTFSVVVAKSLLASALLTGMASQVRAGGGPENVLLVVNSADPKSMTIANHYISLRKIPPGSVFYVNWPDPPHDTKLDEFRDRVLQPVVKAIKDRGLEEQIDYIVYSSGFPYRVEFTEANGIRKSWASITGLTYLSDFVLANRIRHVQSPTINSYAQKLIASEVVSRGFSRRYSLDRTGDRLDVNKQFGRRYYLSMMLGYTKEPGGNALPEILGYLMAAEEADKTPTKGSVYFVKTKNIRSTVRHNHFPLVIKELAKLGIKGVEIQGNENPVSVLPNNKNDVMGAVVGYAKARWPDCKSKFLPGAIIDNFTSYGGRLGGGHSQVMLTHFLRYGAIASSGTVTEPFAILNKFPHPRMHVHYARGCSVAEAFYQSVLQPYQLLIVGDPLCQPWAKPPEVTINGLDTSKQLSGVVEFNAAARSKKGHAIRNLELFVDGKFVKRVLPNTPIRFDTTRVADGYHEFRVVAVEDTTIETRGRATIAFVTANLPNSVAGLTNSSKSGSSSKNSTANKAGKKRPAVEIRGSVEPASGFVSQDRLSPAFVSVSSPGASEIRLFRGRDSIGSTRGSFGRILIPPKELGGGPVTLQPVAFPNDRLRKPILGKPIEVDVEIPR